MIGEMMAHGLFHLTLCSLCCVVYGSVNKELVMLSTCSARTSTGIIDLSRLTYRLEAQLNDGVKMWNYSYSPCYAFNKPDNADTGFGDKCNGAVLCKYGEQSGRLYYYNLGLDNQARFITTQSTPNKTQIDIVYTGYLSMKGKKTYIELVCDRKRTGPQDALFKVTKDIKFSQDRKTLGNVYAELHHVSCCPDGYLATTRDNISDTDGVTGLSSNNHNKTASSNNHNKTASDEVGPGEKDNSVEVDRTKVMIIVGVNIGIIFLAGCVGFMCYSKRSHLEIYHKLPGVRAVAEPKLWQIANSQDIEQVGSGPISSVNGRGKDVSLKAGYRDGAPQRRKSLCFPVLEHSMIPEQTITLGQRLGGGIFGDTYVGEWTGITVSVKRITLSVHKHQINAENLKALQDQVSFLSNQRHRNIVSMLGYCSESKHPYIISEFIQGQVVKDFIKHAGTQLQWPHRVKILSQIADGMAFLHSTNPPILHRDLRCGNLFITSNDVIKICDFGIVRLTQPLRACCQLEDCCCQGLYSACPPSISWTAPEVLEHPNCNETDGDITMATDVYITTAADVYSFGVVMWELVMCDDPYEDMHVVQEVIDHVVSGGRPAITAQSVPLKPYITLMQTCWHASPTQRYDFKQVSVHLKEVLYQAKVFQKVLNNKGSQKTSSKTISFAVPVEKLDK